MKLFIGLPVYSQVPAQFMTCFLALQAQKKKLGFEIVVDINQGDGVARSRNALTAKFLRTDCTHMLQIDCDLIFSAEHVQRIVSHNVDVVGGAYPKKQDGALEWVINTLPNQSAVKPTKGRLLPVKYVGTGFICVKRSVFDKMRKAYPESRYRADYDAREMEFDYWPMSVYRKNRRDEGRYLSEDWFFCQRWQDMGGKVYLDTGTILKHLGPAIFPLQSQMEQIMNPGKMTSQLPA